MKEYVELKPLKDVISQTRGKVYIVGGAVRDWLLGKRTSDVDVVVEEDPRSLLSRDYTWFPLDEEMGIYRVLFDSYTIDISKVQGDGIEEDLRRRDFTVNAVAYDVKAEKMIDPLRAQEDIARGVLRVISEKNIQEDPLRILRGVRLWLYLPLKFEPETLQILKGNVRLLSGCSAERIRDEFFRILSHPLSYKALRMLVDWGILLVIVPELGDCRGLFQGKFYGCDLFEHLLATYRACEVILNFLTYYFKQHVQIRRFLDDEIEQGVTRAALLKFASLLHDIAKPETFVVRDEEYTFWGHDKRGADKAKIACERLRLSARSTNFVERLVANHMRLHILARGGVITERAKGRFFRKLGEEGVAVVLLSLSDSLASSGDRGFYYLLRFAVEMIDFYYEEFLKKESLQKPILTGYDIMDILNIPPGPEVGKIKQKLLDAQTEGKIKDREDAIRFILGLKEEGSDGER